MSKLNYLSRVDVNRKNGLSPINNGLVKRFYKSTLCNQEYYEEVKDEVIREILIEDFEEELQDRKDRGSKFLTKIKLKESLPENADYVSVHYKLSHSIVAIKDIVEINDTDEHTTEYLESYIQSERSTIDELHTLTKWVF